MFLSRARGAVVFRTGQHYRGNAASGRRLYVNLRRIWMRYFPDCQPYRGFAPWVAIGPRKHVTSRGPGRNRTDKTRKHGTSQPRRPGGPQKHAAYACQEPPGRPPGPPRLGGTLRPKRHEKTRYFATPVARSAVKTRGSGIPGKKGVKRTR